MRIDGPALFVALIGGLAAAQAPEFVQQYEQRLGGAIDEIRISLGEFDAQAAGQGLTREQGVRRLEVNSDPLVRERGQDVLRLQTREASLAKDLRQIRSAGPLVRIAVCAIDLDPAIAVSAMRNFTPAVPLSPESGLAGASGFLLGFAAWRAAAWPLRRRARRARA